LFLRILKKFLFVYFAGAHSFWRIFILFVLKSVSVGGVFFQMQWSQEKFH